jgi:hypothetical protein
MNFKIGELHPNTPHLLADLAELLVLVGYNGSDRLHKNHLLALLQQGSTSTDEVDEEARAAKDAGSDAALNDRLEEKLEDVWTQLEYRRRAMELFYPFAVQGDEIRLADVNSIRQRAYRLLLACSRLRSFSGKGVSQRWARIFTRLCQVAMRGLLPSHAVVRIFDANSEDRRDYYGNNLRQALRILGRDLRVLKINEEECDNCETSGDAGLDIVASVDFDDGAAVTYAVLGQCGAQETGWPKKTLEAHAVRYSNFFHFQFHPPAVMFTPVCYRTADGAWVSNQSTNGILLTDRGRILTLLEVQNTWETIENSEWFAAFEAEFSTTVAPD